MTRHSIGLAAAGVLLAFNALGDGEARTPWDTPDFTGHYDTATITPLERMQVFGDRQFIDKESADQWAQRHNAINDLGNADQDPNRKAPPTGGDGSPGPAGNVGGYDSFWIDNGTSLAEFNGQYRTSIIYSPKNGRRPGITNEGRARMGLAFASYDPNNQGVAYWLRDNYRRTRGPYDDPEGLTLADRCLQGFSTTGGPPMLPALYNNQKRIVQGPDKISILVEMVHDARTVRIDSEHPPDDVRYWMGDSIGWWEEDTLVIETTNFNDTPALIPASRDLKVTERFARHDADTLLYSFTVEDPRTYRDKWSGEYTWEESIHPVYEYACHEGNYAMGNILRGARRLERDFYAAQAEEGE